MGKLKEVSGHVVLRLVAKTVHRESVVDREQDERTKRRPRIVHNLFTAMGAAGIGEWRTRNPSFHRQSARRRRNQGYLAAVFLAVLDPFAIRSQVGGRAYGKRVDRIGSGVKDIGAAHRRLDRDWQKALILLPI